MTRNGISICISQKPRYIIECMFLTVLKGIGAFFIDTIQTILLAASVFLVIYIFLFRPFQVSGESMDPTFKDREYILTNLISLRFEDPKPGDVIVFKAPTDENKDYIKRVLAVAGDVIRVDGGVVYINDQQVDESKYLDNSVYTSGGAFLQDGEEIVIPEGHYFVMGDNRPYSSDSREWGFLKRNEIIGKSFFVYWTIHEFRLIKNPF
jgi:signal peptidase I